MTSFCKHDNESLNYPKAGDVTGGDYQILAKDSDL